MEKQRGVLMAAAVPFVGSIIRALEKHEIKTIIVDDLKATIPIDLIQPTSFKITNVNRVDNLGPEISYPKSGPRFTPPKKKRKKK